jgi:hypothetical protein
MAAIRDLANAPRTNDTPIATTAPWKLGETVSHFVAAVRNSALTAMHGGTRDGVVQL